MNFEEKLKTYAELLVTHGLNVQPGQIVNIGTEVIHRDFAHIVAKISYQKGAKFVNIDLSEPRLARTRVLESDDESLSYVPSHLESKYKELVDTTAANLRIIGMEEPDLMSDLDTKKVNKVRIHQRKALKYFYDEGIGKSKVQWTVAAAATPKWGQRLFPDLNGKEAESKLWEAIFSACRADKSNCLELWKEHNSKLHTRGKKLTEMKIKELHFTGPGTDLVVGLSEQAIFKGGTDSSPRNVDFEPNIPTEEVFTTPDYRVTKGHVKATRPFLVNGKLIENLELEFEDGSISKMSATSGEETFREYVSSDPGASRLGEVALVGIDSPIYTSGIIFEEILFDENAACHIAVGSAYKFCLVDGENLDSEKAEAIGCNESSVHTDMMISSEEVDCVATTYDGKKVTLIKSGEWAI